MPDTTTNPPRVFLHVPVALTEARAASGVAGAPLAAAVERLRGDAEAVLDAGPFTVVHPEWVAPSGDPHDYYSFGPYWWPDPASADGLPYIQRDGEMNPVADAGNWQAIFGLSDTATTLAEAAWFTGDARYADRAAVLLRAWFLDEATRMNPHLEYGQAIPGRVTGRGIGIIDTMRLVPLIDAIGLLAEFPCWTRTDQEGVEEWFRAYLTWLTTHPYGLQEREEKNNHGTWYDAQVAAFALFVGDDPLARQTIQRSITKRLAAQVADDGSQPEELWRTRALTYSVFNGLALVNLATLGDRVGVDIWRSPAHGTPSLLRMARWLAQYADGSPFPYKQIVEPPVEPFVMLIRRCANAYQDDALEAALDGITGFDRGTDRVQLTFPRTAAASSNAAPTCG
ncbi:MAG TPA: alginate lyase family protein [Capsulimonadaceae bacterium]|jgi:hypothetical protein